MTIAVDLGCKATKQTNKHTCVLVAQKKRLGKMVLLSTTIYVLIEKSEKQFSVMHPYLGACHVLLFIKLV